MDKRYAIFDMDGTLVDSMGFWKNLASEYLRSKGVANIPADVLERIKPMTMSESAALFRQEFGLQGDIEAEMNAMMADHYRHDIPLTPGVSEYLRKLSEKGVKMCVASATAEHLMESCLGRLGVLPCFAFLLSCETVGAGKDSPLVYLEAARRLGAAPAETAVFEDALYAIETAKNAGFHVVGVYDESADWEAVKTIADEILIWEDIMSASIAIQILPAVDTDTEVVRIVDEVIAYINSTGYTYHVGPFETTIEGDSIDALMDIATECMHVAVRSGASKVSAYIKAVHRPAGEILTIDQKISKYH